MQHSEKFVCLEYSDVELMIPQKDAFSAIFCDSSCFVKDKNGNGKTIFNSQWIPYIDLDKYYFSKKIPLAKVNFSLMLFQLFKVSLSNTRFTNK